MYLVFTYGSYLRRIPRLSALNRMPPSTWQTPLGCAGKCIKQGCRAILGKNANWEVVSYLMFLHDPTPPTPIVPPSRRPQNIPAAPVLVAESYAVLRTGSAVYMQAWSPKDSAETDACQR